MLHPQQKGAYRTLPMYWITRALALGVLLCFIILFGASTLYSDSRILESSPKKNKKLMEPEYQIKHKASTNYNQKESTDAEARTHDPASSIFNKNSLVEIEHQSLPIRKRRLISNCWVTSPNANV